MTRTVAGFSYQELGDLLSARLQEHYRGLELPQLLIPVPLHPARLRERGFNQALVLARQLGRDLQIPVASNALVRIRQTPSQQGLSAKARKRNLRGAFRLQAGLHELGAVALIDDVVTTMSTMHEIAHTLRCAYPDLELHVWCLARA
jgi:ComF family protein